MVELESRMRRNNEGSHVLIMALSTRAKSMTGSTPIALADFGFSLSPNFYDDEYLQEILTRRMTLTLLVLYSIIFTLGIAGNGWVIVILGFYVKKTVNTIWFLNLALSNFFFNCSLPLRITQNAMKLHWPFDKATCKFNNSIAYLNLYANAYFLMTISIEHCASVRSPARAANGQRNRLAWFVAWGIWFLALVFSSPRIHFGNTKHSPIDKEVVICFLSYGNDFIQANLNRHVVMACQYMFGFFIPISVTIVCHVKSYQGLRPERRRLKFFKVLKAATAIFYLCWLPYHVFSFFETQDWAGSLVLTAGIPLTTGLAFASSCINPILYVVVGYDFKERPKPPLLSALENLFGEDGEDSVLRPETKPATEVNSQDV